MIYRCIVWNGQLQPLYQIEANTPSEAAAITIEAFFEGHLFGVSNKWPNIIGQVVRTPQAEYRVTVKEPGLGASHEFLCNTSWKPKFENLDFLGTRD
jgi:hypothetical protein